MANQYDRRRINVKGGGTLMIRAIDPTGATPTSFVSVGFIKDDTFVEEHTMVESIDSAGNYIDTKSGGRKVRWETTLMQTSKDEIDLLRNAAAVGQAEKYFEAYYKVVLNNGAVQEFLFPICRISPSVTLEFKSATERTLKIVINAVAPAAALTRTPTSWNSAQWQPYVMQENATAIGAPTDAPTVPQSAI
jgi:hypothetical protein